MLKLSTKKFILLLTLIFPLSVFADQPATTNWTTFQGNSQHNGYVPVTLNPSLFKEKWQKPLGDLSFIYDQNAVATSKQVFIFATVLDGNYLYSIDADTGNILWQKPISNYQKLINDPTQIDTVANQIVLINLDNNKIFLTYPNDSKTTHLAAYDIDTGATYYDTLISDPMVSDLNIFQNNICLESSDGQTNLNLSCHNEDSGQLTWQANLANIFIQPVTPVITNNIVAALGNDSLNFYDINNGALLSSTSSTSYQIDPRLRTTMTIDSNDQNVITTSDSYGRPMTITNIQNPKNEINIDIAAQNMIATAKNVIYHHSLAPDYKSGISAYDENTGKKLWTTVLPDEWLYAATNPIITDNILFDSITTENGVFYTLAIDLKTHQIVWTHQGELLALTNNTLYISGGSRNVLVAISLS